jgi:2-polyprenyl-3-methyl-5-hydroxy-6-metoxy-1,4-benzoquinol methylase
MLEKIDLIDFLCCPECRTYLIRNDKHLSCSVCGATYPYSDNITNMLPEKSEENDYNMDYVNHYLQDAEIFDYFQERECKATEHDERRVREYIKPLVEDKGKLILDVGSGSAWVAKDLCRDHNVVSFDISEKNIKKAIEKFPVNNHFGVIGDALKSPFKHDVFDYIISSEVIEHIVKPKDFIGNLISLLKPDGKLIISTPYKEVLHYSQCIHCNKMTPKNAHLHSFDENILSGFANDEIEKTKCYIFGNKALIMLRTYIVLRYFPFKIWEIIDKIANLIIRKKAHIVVSYKRKK